MKSLIKKIVAPLAAGVIAMTAPGAFADTAPVKRNLCIFDIIGANGPIFDVMQDYKLASLNWGVDFNMKAYTDEKIAAEDFKAGKCDAVALSGIRSRAFNSFSGSIEAVGAIPSDKAMKVVLQKLASPGKISKFMKNGEYEVVGIAPGGAAYLFTKDRNIDTVGELSGKKIGILSFDKAQSVLVDIVGASPVTVNIANIGPIFNNGSVDIIPSPAVAYEALELYKGLGENGAIIKFPLAQFTLQILTHHNKFPADFGQQSREYIFSQYDHIRELVAMSANTVDPKYWLELPEKDKDGYREMLRQSRLKLKSMGIYDAKALKFLSIVRCAMDNTLAECSAKDRE